MPPDHMRKSKLMRLLLHADVPFLCLFWPVSHNSFLNHMLGELTTMCRFGC